MKTKSPNYPIFPYYYKNGELFGSHFDGFSKKKESELFKRMKEDEEFVLKKHYPLPYWINFYDTKITKSVIINFFNFINNIEKYITRLAIVGCSKLSIWRINKFIKKNKITMKIPVRYYSDPEIAKTWLVGKSK